MFNRYARYFCIKMTINNTQYWEPSTRFIVMMDKSVLLHNRLLLRLSGVYKELVYCVRSLNLFPAEWPAHETMHFVCFCVSVVRPSDQHWALAQVKLALSWITVKR